MSRNTTPESDATERAGNLATKDVVWLGAPYADGSTDPAHVELFASGERAEQYVESLAETDSEWVAWDEREGRQLVERTSGDSIGVVSRLQATVPDETPPFGGSVFERIISSHSPLRSYLPGLTDRPDVDREALPFAYFDLVLFSERGSLQLQAGAATGDEPTRYLDELAAYARKTVDAATGASDDRVARSRIEELNDYFRVTDATGYYGKPRYRLAKRLSDWGGETGRYATLELWLLFQLVLRLYPDHLTWKAGYEYHDDH